MYLRIMKICRKCGNSFQGSKARCNTCLNAYNKANREANLERFRAKAKERYWKNPEKARAERNKHYNPSTKAPYDILYQIGRAHV